MPVLKKDMIFMNMKKTKNTKFKFKPMSPFKTYEEEAHFWDTHNVFDYMDKSTIKMTKNGLVADVDSKKIGRFKKDRSLTIRFSNNLLEKLENIANNLGLSVSTLVRMWTTEKLSTV